MLAERLAVFFGLVGFFGVCFFIQAIVWFICFFATPFFEEDRLKYWWKD